MPVPTVGCLRVQRLSQKRISYPKGWIGNRSPSIGPKQRIVISEQALDVGAEGKPTDTPEIDHRDLGAFCGSCPVPKREG